jgi:hypothetical protein
MKVDDQSVKEREKAAKTTKAQKPGEKENDLEPCTAPQAAEAQRAAAIDEACDDGVN